MIIFEKRIESLLEKIIPNLPLHGKWLNTLSYLENCGARKIASCEHPMRVGQEMLKHAAEEFRHALYLKQQLGRIDCYFADYRISSLIGGWRGYHYLNALDLKVSRYLQGLKKDSLKVKELSYLLVTYAIELRAGELYPVYQKILKKNQSAIKVQSILLEEQGHLAEMEEALQKIPMAKMFLTTCSAIEGELFEQWLTACEREVY